MLRERVCNRALRVGIGSHHRMDAIDAEILLIRRPIEKALPPIHDAVGFGIDRGHGNAKRCGNRMTLRNPGRIVQRR